MDRGHPRQCYFGDPSTATSAADRNKYSCHRWREFEFQKQNMMSHFKGSDFVEVEHLHDGFGDGEFD